MGKIWEQLLHISGGRLELSKCFWVPIVWKWRNGRPYCSGETTGRHKELILKESETKEDIIIPKRRSKDAEKRLGVWSNCEHTWSKEYNTWMEFSKIFAGKVKRAGLHRVAGYHAYHAIWLAKFRYSAPMIGITSNQVKKIYTGVLSSCLSAGGYSNKMPRAVVFGPTILGGMDWNNPLIIYLHEKIKMLVGSIRLKDTVGRLMLMQIS